MRFRSAWLAYSHPVGTRAVHVRPKRELRRSTNAGESAGASSRSLRLASWFSRAPTRVKKSLPYRTRKATVAMANTTVFARLKRPAPAREGAPDVGSRGASSAGIATDDGKDARGEDPEGREIADSRSARSTAERTRTCEADSTRPMRLRSRASPLGARRRGVVRARLRVSRMMLNLNAGGRVVVRHRRMGKQSERSMIGVLRMSRFSARPLKMRNRRSGFIGVTMKKNTRASTSRSSETDHKRRSGDGVPLLEFRRGAAGGWPSRLAIVLVLAPAVCPRARLRAPCPPARI